MKDRIVTLIKAMNLTAAQFAEEIGVQKSGISHIISGRNNPSLDFIQKVMQRFPEINVDWLIQGKGPMIKSETNKNELIHTPPPGSDNLPLDLFSPQFLHPKVVEPVEKGSPEVLDLKENEGVKDELNSAKVESEPAPVYETVSRPSKKEVLPDTEYQSTGKKIRKIVVFYSDMTYEEFSRMG